MRKYSFIMIVLLPLAFGCTRDFDLAQEQTAPRYVIEGRISNLKGPYYVRVTKADNSLGANEHDLSGLDNAEPVKGALVIITDDTGITDTLVPVAQNNPRYEPANSGDRGYYGSSKLTGQPGHTYQLKVSIGTETFQASAYLPVTVPAIDSVTLIRDNDFSKADEVFTYFHEPKNEPNYYFQNMNAPIDSIYDAARTINFGPTSAFPYVFDDKTLPPYVAGMQVRTIISDNFGQKRISPFWVIPNDDFQVRLCALTRNTYDYFKALEKQFLTDGNVYQPAPSSARGNISGNALGLFYALNISSKVVLQ